VGVNLVQEDIPEIGEDDVLVKTKAVGICGTDKTIYKWLGWAQKNVSIPLTIGHELSGEVVQIGKNVDNIKTGDAVTLDSHLYCGECSICKNSNKHVCKDLKIIGVNYNGVFSEYVRVPAKIVWKHKEHIPHEIAVLKEPFGNAVHALTANDNNLSGKTVLIYGGGVLGAMSIIAAKYLGAKMVIVIENDKEKFQILKKFGADFTFRDGKEAINDVLNITKSYGVDIAVDYVTNSDTVKNSLDMLANGKKLSILGLSQNSITIEEIGDAIMKGKQIIGVSGRKYHDTWNIVEDIVNTKKGLLRDMVTVAGGLVDYKNAFKLSFDSSNLKVVMIND